MAVPENFVDPAEYLIVPTHSVTEFVPDISLYKNVF